VAGRRGWLGPLAAIAVIAASGPVVTIVDLGPPASPTAAP
jgi:hypothetical protein